MTYILELMWRLNELKLVKHFSEGHGKQQVLNKIVAIIITLPQLGLQKAMLRSEILGNLIVSHSLASNEY